ncbi:MAG: hypothetical protein HYZ62_00805, partial [Candidatus Andersenbacteria bacterium]|nr:hypothetical protein [Candidatus Andersenbacteria bacterium]
SRGADGDFDIIRANQHSYPIYHLPTLVFPRFFGQDNTYWGKRLEIEYGFFIGTSPLILAIGAIWRYLKHKSGSHDQRFFMGAAIISFLLALGSLSPFRLIGVEPSLWVFSAPARWLFITSFSLALFAGWGLDTIQKTILKNKWLLAAIWAAAGAVTWALTQPNITNQIRTTLQNLGGIHEPAQVLKLSQLLGYASHTSLSLYSAYTYLPLLALTIIAFTPRSYLKKTIVAVSLLELLIIAITTSPTVSWRDIVSIPQTVRALPEAVFTQQARLLVVQPEGSDTGAWFTNPTSRADARIRQQQKDLLVPLVNTQFHIPGVAWPASLDIQAISQAIASLDTTDRLALAELNIGAQTRLRSGQVTITTHSPKPRIGLLDANTNIENEISYKPSAPGRIQTTVEAIHDSQLVIRDAWYPGWIAYLDSRPVPIDRIGPHNIFRAIIVPSGQHTIELRYEPKLLYVGIAVTIIAVLGGCAVVALGYKIRT